jgi:glucose/arabinose dehydrogenase
MKKIIMIIFLSLFLNIQAQEESEFFRKVLPIHSENSWDICIGDDGFLYLNEYPNRIYRVHPEIGEKEILYTINDFHLSDESENHPGCNTQRLYGFRGLALHPDFTNPDSSYIFCFYSYNNGTEEEPVTDFKIIRIKWNEAEKIVTEEKVIVENIPGGWEHSGGRMITIKENNTSYLYYTVGDMGPTPTDCLEEGETHSRETVQDPNYPNGKIHRIMIDGSIPDDNPIPGNSFWTRGHRNPQGLTYNPETGIIYSVEHGATTDDEVNVIEKGMNYGWYQVHGNHDGNRSGEMDFVENYQPNPDIAGDKLVEPLYSWCREYTTDEWWLACTVAPSGAQYYGYDAIPGWKNSIVVACLKQAQFIVSGLRVVRLAEDGKSLIDSTMDNPNPELYFDEFHRNDGRIRDVEFSKDGRRIFIINNGGYPEHDRSVIVYTYSPLGSVFDEIDNLIYPNPVADVLHFGNENFQYIKIINIAGKIVLEKKNPRGSINLSSLKQGVYLAEITYKNQTKTIKLIKK